MPVIDEIISFASSETSFNTVNNKRTKINLTSGLSYIDRIRTEDNYND